MGNVIASFKKPKGPEITDADRAVLSLKTQRRKLEDQEKLLGQRIEQQGVAARQLLSEKRRDRALLALRKKKMSEQQILALHKLIMTVEDMLGSLETTKQQAKLFAVLKQGSDALKQLQQQVKVEDVQRLMDDTAESKAYQEELQAVLGQSLSSADESDVEAELEGMENAMIAMEASLMPKAPEVSAEDAAAADLARLDAKVEAARQAAEDSTLTPSTSRPASAGRQKASQEEESREEAQQSEPMLAS